MSIDFLKPIWFMLLPLVFAGVVWIAHKGRFPSKFQKWLHTGVRLFVCLLLILAMTTPQISRQTEQATTLFLLDCSASVADVGVTDFLQEAYESKSEKDSLGLIVFGENAGVIQSPSADNTTPKIQADMYVDAAGTNIDGALRLADGIFTDGQIKRVVLLSDGEETRGDALALAQSLLANGVIIDVYPLAAKEKPEVQLTELELPSVVNKGMEYEISLRIHSTVQTDAQVKLYKGNVLIGHEQVSISSGESRMVFADMTEAGGSVVYRAEISAKEDTNTKNNQAYAFTVIDDVPRVLILETGESGANWAALLSASGLQVERRNPAGAPVSLEDIQSYEGVIIANVSATEMPSAFLDVLEAYVRTLGGGLLVSGGEHAFALGEYYHTKFEDVLPVDMELKTEGEEHDLAMVMVIDRSGSMSSGAYGISLLEIAKEAAIRSLDNLKDRDQVGVIAFDDAYTWAVPMTKISGNKEHVVSGISNIQLGGGTSILPGLREAVDVLSITEAKEKHIILLTDGQAERTGYEATIDKMNQDGITLSSVAIGEGADTWLLEWLAEAGDGRYYFANEFTDLPSIFAKETILAGKEYLNNRTFYPSAQDASAILSGINSVPALHGYVGTTAKSRAHVILVSDKDEPVLATWQYGLGRSAVWTSDVGGDWTADWLATPEGADILRNTVSWVLNKQVTQDIKLYAYSSGEKSNIRLEMSYDEAVESVGVVVLDSSGRDLDVVLEMVAPGIYEGVLDTADEGAYMANVEVLRQDGTVTNSNIGFSLSYPLEYDMTYGGDGQRLLGQLAQSTGGRVLGSASEIFSNAAVRTISQKDISGILLILALISFLIDIALRRFSILPVRLEQKILALQMKRKNKSGQKRNVKAAKEALPEAKEEHSARAGSAVSKETEKEISSAVQKQQSTAQKLAAARKKREKH